MRLSSAMMRRRMAGRLGWGGGPGSDGVLTLFPPEPQMLEEGVRAALTKCATETTAG